jgi:hypothetical protein
MAQSSISESISAILKWFTEILRPPVILSSILIATICSIFLTFNQVVIITLLWLSCLGLFDYIFRQAKLALNIRCQRTYKPDIVWTRISTENMIKTLKEFNYAGFFFYVGGHSALNKTHCAPCLIHSAPLVVGIFSHLRV